MLSHVMAQSPIPSPKPSKLHGFGLNLLWEDDQQIFISIHATFTFNLASVLPLLHSSEIKKHIYLKQGFLNHAVYQNNQLIQIHIEVFLKFHTGRFKAPGGLL
jgi:hypothetical protein